MDMHAAYQEVGSYRAAAEICGTTDKTVKRVVEAAQRVEALGSGGEVVAVAHNYDPVRTIVAERVKRTSARSRGLVIPTAWPVRTCSTQSRPFRNRSSSWRSGQAPFDGGLRRLPA